MTKPFIFIFAALSCEAKPYIQPWKLKKLPGNHPFAIYLNDERVLVVTGIGKIAMSAGIAYTLALFPQTLPLPPILLNLGIAGHQHWPLGHIFLADKITDQDSNKRFYPQFPFTLPCATRAVLTLTHVQAEYCAENAYDMEASAFYEVAGKFSSNELIHSLKVISDNAQSPADSIKSAQVEIWIQQHEGIIEQVIAQLVKLRSCVPEMDEREYQQILTEFHFTVSNAGKLKSLLQRWQVLHGELPDCKVLEAANARDLLLKLEQLLEQQKFLL